LLFLQILCFCWDVGAPIAIPAVFMLLLGRRSTNCYFCSFYAFVGMWERPLLFLQFVCGSVRIWERPLLFLQFIFPIVRPILSNLVQILFISLGTL
jgi:hypothetical protein